MAAKKHHTEIKKYQKKAIVKSKVRLVIKPNIHIFLYVEIKSGAITATA